MYLFLKSLDLSRSAAFFGAVSFSFSGAFITFVNDLSFLQGITFLPFILYFINRFINKPTIAGALLVSLFLFFQFMSGDLLISYTTWVFAAIYFWLFTNFRLASTLRSTILIFGIFIGLAAIQIIPFVELQDHIATPHQLTDISYQHIQLATLPNLFLPQIFPDSAQSIGNIGILPLLVGLVAFTNKVKLRTAVFLTAAFIYLTLSLGTTTPLFTLVKSTLPYFYNFQEPYKLLVFFCFSISTLAALGFQSNSHSKIFSKFTPKPLNNFLPTILITTLVIELFLLSNSQLNFTHPPTPELNPPNLPTSTNRYLSISDTNFLEPPAPFIDFPKTINTLPTNLNLLNQHFSPAGRSNIILQNYASYWNSAHTNTISVTNLDDWRLQTMGVEYLIAHPSLDLPDNSIWQPVADTSTNLYRSTHFQPRVFFQQSAGSAQITSYTPNQITIETDNSIEDSLILTDAYYPGWQATIDDHPTTINPFDRAFRQIQVPAGAHTITFSYQPTSVRIGLGFTLITLIICLILLRWPNHKLL